MAEKQLLCRFTFSDVKHIYSIIYSSKPYYTHSKVFVFPKSKRGIRSCVKWQGYMVLHILCQILIYNKRLITAAGEHYMIEMKYYFSILLIYT